MRRKVVNKLINYIKKNKSIDKITEEKLIYGLEAIYILVTKLTFIIILSIILGIFKEMIIFLGLFSIIRLCAFGLHATKSYICLIVSSVCFILIPYMSKALNINMYTKLIISIIFTILILIHSPADTYKRPIINKNRRIRLKIISTLIAIIYTIVIPFSNNFISNCLLFSLLLEVIFISPLTYRIFKLPYNNYKKYLERDE
jgi:accessory gene regulator B